jgi:hypothetical protein
MTMAVTKMQFEGPDFHLEVPTRWLITSTPDVQVLFLGPAEGRAVRPNFAIAIRVVDDGVTAADIASLTAAVQQDTYAQYALEYEHPLSLDGVPGVELRYGWHNADAGITVVQTQRLVVRDNLLYALTATHAADETPAIIQLLDEMLESFALDPVG